jgi:hypothetical protein
MAAFDKRDPQVKSREGAGGTLSLCDVPGLLDDNNLAEQDAVQLKGKLKYLEATARNGYLQWQCRELFDAMGTVDSLRFFSEELYTYSVFCSSETVDGRRCITSDEIDLIKDCSFDGGGYYQFYVFDKSKYKRVIDDIDRFLKWSVEHPKKVAQVFYGVKTDGRYSWVSGETNEKVEQDLIAEIEAVPVFIIPEADEARGDDGMGVEVGFDDWGLRFTYRMIKAVRHLLEYADAAGLDVVYYNGMPNSGYKCWADMMGVTLPDPPPRDVRKDEDEARLRREVFLPAPQQSEVRYQMHYSFNEVLSGKLPTSGFCPGTTVWLTTEEWTEIQFVEVGLEVLSRSEETGEMRRCKVTNTFIREDVPVFYVYFNDENGVEFSSSTTAEHPFWVKGQGWTKVSNLKLGQLLELKSGKTATITEVKDAGWKTTVYNIEVEGFHTYFVEGSGVWVHNKNGEERT